MMSFNPLNAGRTSRQTAQELNVPVIILKERRYGKAMRYFVENEDIGQGYGTVDAYLHCL